MSKNSKLLIVLLAIMLAFVISGVAQQSAADTATDPVCGMTVKMSEAKATYEYKGTTYYFCSQGCKDKFVKDPEAYLQKKDEAKAAYTCPMHPECKSVEPGKCPKCGMEMKKQAMTPGHMHGQMMGQCPMMKHCAGMGGGHQAMMKGEGQGCGMACPLHSKDVEIKKENSADGVTIKISSKNPEMVKKIQEHMAGAGFPCPAAHACCAKEQKK